MPISTGVVSHEEEEGGLPGGFASPIVVCELGDWEVVRPVVLLVVDKEP